MCDKFKLKNNPMKMLFYSKYLIAILLIFQLSSCKDKDTLPAEFNSTLSSEEQKERLDEEGITFIEDMKAMEDPDLMNPILYFIQISPSMNEDLIEVSASLANDFILSSKNISGNYLKYSTVENYVSIQELMTGNQGIYTYNRLTETWSKTNATGKIEFVFPSGENKTTNNTTFTISNLSTSQVTNSELYDDLSDLPKTLNLEFRVDNVLKNAFYFSSAYNTDNLPSSEKITLFMSPYTITQELANNNKEVTASTTIKNESKTILSFEATADGTFDYSTISSENEIGDLFENANINFQIENVKISGSMDYNTISTKLEALELKYREEYIINNQYPEQYYLEYATILNENGKLKALFADKNEIFANLIAYPTLVDEDDDRYQIGFKVVFTDESQVDASYFDSGFELFTTNINQLIESINSDYDTDLPVIDAK